MDSRRVSTAGQAAAMRSNVTGPLGAGAAVSAAVSAAPSDGFSILGVAVPDAGSPAAWAGCGAATARSVLGAEPEGAACVESGLTGTDPVRFSTITGDTLGASADDAASPATGFCAGALCAT